MPVEDFNYDGQRICNVPDHFGAADCLWPFMDVSIYVPPGMKLGQVDLAPAVEQAIAAWNEACGINLRMAVNQNTANIVLTSGPIDGPSNVLAQSELPCGFQPGRVRQLFQLFDNSEAWTVGDNPPANRIDAVRVIRHEVGHAIGIGHINSGNLMAPVYSAQIRGLQRGDVAEGRSRYGLPAPVSPPTPQPPPTTTPPVTPGVNGTVTFTLPDGSVWSGKVARI